MSDSLEFAGGESARNETRNGAPRAWAWAEDGRGVKAAYRGYYKKEGFFSVIWQVNLPKAGQETKPIWTHRVRLQVESPVREVDRGLNDLKRELVRAILESDLAQTVHDANFGYDSKGLRTSDEAVRDYQTTTVFRVKLNDKQSKLSADDKIGIVHAVLGSKVDAIVRRFSKKLNERFPLA